MKKYLLGGNIMLRNIKFIYLYRDSSNFKDWGEVVFFNEKEMDIDSISKDIIRHLDSGVFFVAEKISIPPLDLYKEECPSWCNIWFHEYSDIEFTEERPTDTQNRDFSVFLKELKSSSFSNLYNKSTIQT
jgi:hypothetical protein